MKSQSNKKNIKGFLGLLAINVLLAAIGLELVSLGFYYSQNKKLFYAAEKKPARIRQDLEKIGTRQTGGVGDQNIIERLHPFFAYVLEPGAFEHKESGLKINNYGFFSLYDYPFIRTNDNQFVVAVFGGSVANNFYVHAVVNNKTKNTGFIQKLRGIPELKDKEIILLNFAGGGYKQPQQLLILNYFLSIGQPIDMIINIDGFNEVALSSLNNKSQIELSLPSVQHLQGLTSVANSDIKMMRSVVDLTDNKNQLMLTIDRLENCKLAICHSWYSLKTRRLFNSYQESLIKYDQRLAKAATKMGGKDSLVFFTKMPKVLDDQTAYKKMVDNWFESSLSMKKIADSRNIAYFNIIQPNQYYQTKRVFTAEEKNGLVIPDHPYAEGVKKGYPVLLSRVNDLKNMQVNIFSAVNIFDQQKETVYKDACCHFNDLGEDMFADFIFNSIQTTIQQNPALLNPPK
ncbi:MAG: hypothetical protein ACRC2J_07925 [Microcoleaceae cyanobacterium]